MKKKIVTPMPVAWNISERKNDGSESIAIFYGHFENRIEADVIFGAATQTDQIDQNDFRENEK